MRGIIRGQKGAMEIVLILATVFLVAALALLSQVSGYSQQVLMNAERVSARNLEDWVLTNWSDVNICSCHFDAAKNTAAFGWTVDTTVPNPPGWAMTELRSGCDFANPNNVIVSTAADPASGQKVDSIRITDLQPAGATQYTAKLMLYMATSSGAYVAPQPINIAFNINTAAGTPTGRPIASCAQVTGSDGGGGGSRGGGFISSCPAGFTLEGRPGERSTFCISTATLGPLNWLDASAECAGMLFPDLPRATLCDLNSWTQACVSNPGLGLGSEREWLAHNMWWAAPGLQQVTYNGDASIMAPATGALTCQNMTIGNFTETNKYRCCIRFDATGL